MQKTFDGFPDRAEVTPLPNIFFTEVLPAISDINEIKTVMQVFFLLSRRKGYPRFVTFKELLNDSVINSTMYDQTDDIEAILRKALDLAVQHKILLHISVNVGEEPDDIYFINNQTESNTIERIMCGTLQIPNIRVREKESKGANQQKDIYSLYEQNIGLLTPIIAEELQEAEQRYPAEWIQDAFKEALRANVPNWRYIHSILKRWGREGKKDGKYVGDYRRKRDPDKYIRGKYGHMVQR